MASILDGVPVVEDEVFRGTVTTKESKMGARTFAPAFNPGERVRLKSGGPAMTVLSCRPAGVEVTWHPADGTMHKAVVPPDALTASE